MHAMCHKLRMVFMQDKAGENAMRAVDMLESMFKWLLQPARSDDIEVPTSPTASGADGQPVEAPEVICHFGDLHLDFILTAYIKWRCTKA